MTENTQKLSDVGVSIWLDDLSRERISSGGLQKLIDEKNVVGVTTNPTIFAAALANGESYSEQVAALAAKNTDVTDAVFEITTDDVAAASDIFKPIYDASKGFDGRVSIEVEPGLAHDAQGTIAQAKALSAKVDRENVLIKIPATVEGLEAITETIAAGISVNVTLIFSLERYRDVINAYLTGLEKAKEAGHDLSKIHSVASFFVSRVDTEIDKRLTAIGTDEALALKSKAGIANAQLAYEVWTQAFATERALLLLEGGANTQRPLWASTGVKDPSVPDTAYVVELAAPSVVNTMPEKTLEALSDHGEVRGDTIAHSYEGANKVLDAIGALGISYAEVTELLEKEGVEKFIVSWNELLDTVTAALKAAE
ncbi:MULTISPECIES: transaldolase [Herbiconiux]|jgi:transaldolase|uniref:Transaldolase n=1 Tax=Herbiconiux flava TaxID=881268 RepID=A0A852SRG0_9MICO|nr:MULTISPECIES: transaldolase [Herbiconiux]NQX33731.1 transaldolase [Herbiconiux sp. VKM Ac-2851]NYD71411.1 transaldolase [Herbiconiux flava]GLK18625.1 transaldolase 2 [Herbiconiux flava]